MQWWGIWWQWSLWSLFGAPCQLLSQQLLPVGSKDTRIQPQLELSYPGKEGMSYRAWRLKSLWVIFTLLLSLFFPHCWVWQPEFSQKCNPCEELVANPQLLYLAADLTEAGEEEGWGWLLCLTAHHPFFFFFSLPFTSWPTLFPDPAAFELKIFLELCCRRQLT